MANSLSRILSTLLALAFLVLAAGQAPASADPVRVRVHTCVLVEETLSCVPGEFVPVGPTHHHVQHAASFYDGPLYNATGDVTDRLDVYNDICLGGGNFPPEWDNRVSSVIIHNCATLLYENASYGGRRIACTNVFLRCEHLAVWGMDNAASSFRFQ